MIEKLLITNMTTTNLTMMHIGLHINAYFLTSNHDYVTPSGFSVNLCFFITINKSEGVYFSCS